LDLLRSTSGDAFDKIAVESIFWSSLNNYVSAHIYVPASTANNILARCDRNSVLKLKEWGPAHVSTGDSNAKTWAVRLLNVPQQFEEHHLKEILPLHELKLIRATREQEPRSGLPRMKCWNATIHSTRRPPRELPFFLPNSDEECFRITVHCQQMTMPTLLLDVNADGALVRIPPSGQNPTKRPKPAPAAHADDPKQTPTKNGTQPQVAAVATAEASPDIDMPEAGEEHAKQDEQTTEHKQPKQASAAQGDTAEQAPATEGTQPQVTTAAAAGASPDIDMPEAGVERAKEGEQITQDEQPKLAPAAHDDGTEQAPATEGDNPKPPPAAQGNGTEAATTQEDGGSHPDLAAPSDGTAASAAAAEGDGIEESSDKEDTHPTNRKLFETPPRQTRAGATRKQISTPIGPVEPSPPHKRSKDHAPTPEAPRRSQRLQEQHAREG